MTQPMSKDNEFDWKTFENEAIARLLKGDELSGSDGILTPLIQRLLQVLIISKSVPPGVSKSG